MGSLKKIIIILILSIFFVSSFCLIFISDVVAIVDNFQLQQTVVACNNNGSCEAGETSSNCPNDCVVAPTPTPVSVSGIGGAKGVTLPNVINLEVHPIHNSAFISWSVTKLSYAVLQWGKTEECEMGSVSGLEILIEHKAFLDNLEPDTFYYFVIELMDEDGNKNSIYPQRFKTLTEPDVEFPANVKDLIVVRLGESNAALLKWTNPSDVDFAGVRIVRSDRFFPQGIYDGTTVYEGDESTAVDINLEEDITYYYSVFAYDFSGNYSSGAIATFAIHRPGVPVVIPVVPPDQVPPEVAKMDLSFFRFFQDDLKLPVIDGKFIIDSGKPFKILLPYEQAPEVLKTIVITLFEPSEEKKQFSFLLKVNKDKTGYEAIIAPLKAPGLYEASIAVLDYKNQALKKFKTLFWVEGIQAVIVKDKDGDIEKGDAVYKSAPLFWWFLFLALLILIIWMIFRKKKKENEEGILEKQHNFKNKKE